MQKSVISEEANTFVALDKTLAINNNNNNDMRFLPTLLAATASAQVINLYWNDNCTGLTGPGPDMTLTCGDYYQKCAPLGPISSYEVIDSQGQICTGGIAGRDLWNTWALYNSNDCNTDPNLNDPNIVGGGGENGCLTNGCHATEPIYPDEVPYALSVMCIQTALDYGG